MLARTAAVSLTSVAATHVLDSSPGGTRCARIGTRDAQADRRGAGALAVGQLAIGRARIRRLVIDELDVGRLRVEELEVASERRPSVDVASGA